jgi:hypothetical protein
MYTKVHTFFKNIYIVFIFYLYNLRGCDIHQWSKKTTTYSIAKNRQGPSSGRHEVANIPRILKRL